MIELPIDRYLPNVVELLRANSSLVLSALPGSGKTTRVPPVLAEEFPGKILVLEPRRISAIGASARVAEERKWTLGQEVGYQVRFERRVSSNTRLVYMTEALLARQMLRDPNLEDVSVVVLDEFHERSVHVDVALGLIHEMQLLGSRIKLVVMSATLETRKISEFLVQAPCLEVPGLLHPLEIQHQKKAQILRSGPELTSRVVEAVKKLNLWPDHQALVFLPGAGEIIRLQRELLPWATTHNVALQCLYGSQSLEEQKEVLREFSGPRVVLATNIAESSLTIPGIDRVIDTGLERVNEFNLNTQTESLSLQKISKASAQQRSGRSARQRPGVSIRLWTKTEEGAFKDFGTPEIQRLELSPVILQLAQQGVRDFENFSWYEKPHLQRLQWTIQELIKIEALDNEKRVTALGKDLFKFPLPPRQSLWLSLAQKESAEVSAVVCQCLGVWQDPDGVSQVRGGIESDLYARLDPMSSKAKRISEQLESLCGIDQKRSKIEDYDIQRAAEILLKISWDKICRRRGRSSDRALQVGGRGVKLDAASVVKTSEFFIPLSMMQVGSSPEIQVNLAWGFSKEVLLKVLGEKLINKTKIVFQSERQKIQRESNLFLEDLPIHESQFQEATDAEIKEHLPEIISSAWEEIWTKNQSLRKLSHRIERYKSLGEELQEDALRKHLCEAWTLEHQNFKSLFEVDLEESWLRSLPEGSKKNFETLVPKYWKSPKGKSFEIQYPLGQSPSVEAKIQDLFGLKKHPHYGGEALVIHLLAPNFRPTQVTKDIVNFWRGSYHQVKKELKPRYPKHPWPEDPENF